jgi:hypothetical protein
LVTTVTALERSSAGSLKRVANRFDRDRVGAIVGWVIVAAYAIYLVWEIAYSFGYVKLPYWAA